MEKSSGREPPQGSEHTLLPESDGLGRELSSKFVDKGPERPTWELEVLSPENVKRIPVYENV